MSEVGIGEVRELSEIRPMALYTVHDLAPLLRVTPRTLRRYCSQKVFASAVSLRGKGWLILGRDVLALWPAVELTN